MGKVEVWCEWCRKPVLVAEAHIAELETSLTIANTTAANLMKRIAELNALGKASTKCLHEEEQDNARLRECLKTAIIVIENAVSAYPSRSGSKALEELRKELKEGE
jgi:hypothetical protein